MVKGNLIAAINVHLNKLGPKREPWGAKSKNVPDFWSFGFHWYKYFPHMKFSHVVNQFQHFFKNVSTATLRCEKKKYIYILMKTNNLLV